MIDIKQNNIDDNWFDEIVGEAYNSLPHEILSKIDNVEIIVDDYPKHYHLETDPQNMLLGLYTGIPLSKRGTFYGTFPTLPDRITIFKQNILRICRNEQQMKEKIYEVLFHEIGHYFGMNEQEIRDSMMNFKLKDFE